MPGAIDVTKTLLVQILIIILGFGLIGMTDIPIDYWGSLGISAIYWALLAGVVSTLLIALPKIKPHASISRQLNQINIKMYQLMKDLSWSSIILISIFAGVGEELLFRNFLQVWISELSYDAVGIIVTSLIFGLLHFHSFLYFMITLILGLLFGIAFYETQSLAFVMVWHAFHDFIALGALVKFPHLIGIKYVR